MGNSSTWLSNTTMQGEQLAKQHEFTQLPVDPFEIADNLGIEIQALPHDKKGVSGMLLQSGGNFGIMYATYLDNPGFKNFCVAHELGHYSIPGHPEQVMNNGQHTSHGGFTSGDRYELEADHFAAGLLMPSYLFDAVLNKNQSGLVAVKKLAKECETSITASAIRYAQRSPDPIAIVVSEDQSVCYCFMSEAMKQLEGLSWIKKGARLPKDSVTSRFNQLKSNITKCHEAEGSSSLLAWFNSNLDYELYEETLGLGNYEKSLTVLSIDEEIADPEEIEDEEALLESWTPRFRR